MKLLVIEDDHETAAYLVKGLSESGYTLFIANSQYDQRRELQELQSLIERGIDGIVLVGP